jgi:alpha-amylase
MTTKNNAVSMDRGIYESPYDAFTNYMNILGDFLQRVNWALPLDIDTEELNAFQTTISNQDKKIQSLERQVARLKAAADKPKKK